MTANAIGEGRGLPGAAQAQLSGWDVESSLWLRWCLTLNGSAGDVSDDWALRRE